jgi:hypothetical protein
VIGRDQRLDTAAGLRLGREKSVDDRIGNAVADLVGVTFRYGFAREDKSPLAKGVPFLNTSSG